MLKVRCATRIAPRGFVPALHCNGPRHQTQSDANLVKCSACHARSGSCFASCRACCCAVCRPPLCSQTATSDRGAVGSARLRSIADRQGVDPCENFYRFSCNGWFKRNPLPPDQTSYGRFTELYELNRLHLKQILEDGGRPASTSRSAKRAEDRRRVCELHGHGRDRTRRASRRCNRSWTGSPR